MSWNKKFCPDVHKVRASESSIRMPASGPFYLAIKTLPCRRKAPSTWTQPVRADTNPRPGYVRMGRDSRPCGRGCAFEQKIYHASDLPPTRFLHADTIVAKSHKRSRGQRPHLDVHVYPRDNLGFFVQETCLNSFIIQNIDALTIKD
jgi:hypothetical protein